MNADNAINLGLVIPAVIRVKIWYRSLFGKLRQCGMNAIATAFIPPHGVTLLIEFIGGYSVMNRVILIFTICSFLTACATSLSNVNKRVGANQPLPYKEGFAAGCDSGYVAAGHPYYKFNKNVNRFSEDAMYKQGWEDGYGVCKGSYESIQRLSY